LGTTVLKVSIILVGRQEFRLHQYFFSRFPKPRFRNTHPTAPAELYSWPSGVSLVTEARDTALRYPKYFARNNFPTKREKQASLFPASADA